MKFIYDNSLSGTYSGDDVVDYVTNILKEENKTFDIKLLKLEYNSIEIKTMRAFETSNIKVTLSNGVILDGDEDSQNRITRAISALDNDDDVIPWRASDNKEYELNRPLFREASKLAGLEQTKIWQKYANINA
jgi:hypothetical protein